MIPVRTKIKSVKTIKNRDLKKMNSEPLDLSKNNFISNFPLSQPGAGSMQLNPISAISPITPLHQQQFFNLQSLITKLANHRQQNSQEDDNEKIDLVRKRGWDQIMDQSDVTDSKKLKADPELDQATGSSAGLDLTKSKTEEVLSASDSGNHSGDEGEQKRIF